MKFDSIVIGGGMAGLSAALRLAEAGQKTLLMASGQSALHFSSGSVDLLESDGDPRAPLPPFFPSPPDPPSIYFRTVSYSFFLSHFTLSYLLFLLFL
uniref:FAD-dependent oxidoreductase n=1 Tax=Aeromonas caviae TaxID=648 RepID=UPI0025B6922F